MISRTDLYIEKLIAKMNLDDAQRVEVERELRAHLEEAVQSGVAGGLTAQQAEDEALLRFGQPSVLARQFGSLNGTAWLIFEKLAMATLVYWVLGVICGHPHDAANAAPYWWPPFISTLCALLYFCSAMWNRVVVNGTLRVYRFFRPTVSIPFESIRTVSLQSGHLFGRRRVRIEHDNGHITVSSGLRNFRCASMAIEALAPQSLPDGVTVLTNKLHLAVSQEGGTLRRILTVTWVAVLGAYIFALPTLWNARGIPYFFVAAAAVGELAILVHAGRSANRAKRGTTALLVIAWHVYIVSFAVSFWGLGEAHCRWAVTVFPVFGLLPVLQLWWTWSRRDLVLTISIALVGVVIARSAIVNGWNRLSSVGAPQCLSEATTVGRDTQTYLGIGTWNSSNSSDSLSCELYRVPMSTQRGSPSRMPLPAGTWTILGQLTSDTVALGHEYPKGTTPQETVSDVYVTSEAGEIKRMTQLQPECTMCATGQGLPFFSPARSYLLTPVTPGYSGEGPRDLHKVSIGMTNLKTGALKRFNAFPTKSAWRWMDDENLLAINAKTTTAPADGGTTSTYEHEVWALNARTGNAHLQRKFTLGDGSLTFIPWNSSKYARTDGYVVDLETGSLTPIPNMSVTKTFAWDPAAWRYACIVGENEQLKLQVFDRRGLVTSCNLPSGANEYNAVCGISPQGNRVFVFFRERSRTVLWSLALATLDTRSGELRVLERVPFLPAWSSVLLSSIYSWTYPTLQWTPDEEPVYPVFGTLRLGAPTARRSQEEKRA